MTFEKIKYFICEQLAISDDEITLSSRLSEDLYADSLDMMEIALLIEEEYDQEIPDDAFDTIATVGDLVSYVDRHIK